nr:receptor-like protein 12 isoform X1 [Ipomoea batatas]
MNILKSASLNFSKLDVLILSIIFLDELWFPLDSPLPINRARLRSFELGPKFLIGSAQTKLKEGLDNSKTGVLDLIPQWFTNLSNLAYLSASQNRIHEKLPNIPSTMFLVDFSSNLLEGPIPKNYSGVSASLNLSKNKLSGTISVLCTNHSTWLDQLDLSNNFFTEKIPECLGKLNYLRSLNLANNNLFGEIPLSIGHLDQMVSLHLRSNRFVGEFPMSLQNCTSLKVLDLGNNYLTGGIPAWIGESLKELKILCLDSNELKGSIPKIYGILNSFQEDVFDYEWLMWKGIKREYGFTEAYQGNSKLRGPPLQTKCHRDEPGNAPQQGGIEEDEGWIIWDFGFFVSLTLGFILGFWGVCGTLILKRSWRHAYFQFLEDKKEKICTTIVVYGAKLKRGMRAS